MDITVYPGKLSGTLNAIASKSQAHRVLICAAFSDKETTIVCPQTNDDIEATRHCLIALGAKIQRTESGYYVTPIQNIPETAVLDCRESGSTLRFMLPIAGALGVDVTFIMHGRLPDRPLSPLWEEMQRMGCVLTRPAKNALRCQGKLHAGVYIIDGSVSSQFITGLLLATALITGQSRITVTGKLESEPYIRMTKQVLQHFGVQTDNYTVDGCLPFTGPEQYCIEGDWSNAAFFLSAAHMGHTIDLCGLNPTSEQGDKACAHLFRQLKAAYLEADCKDIPDLVPILAVFAAAHHGATFTNINRLRLKESDRVQTVLHMLRELHIDCRADENNMYITPGCFYGNCTVDSAKDHRIAMAAAIAATIATDPVTILNADCVKKSYPSFWDEFHRLGGKYEQHIR